MNGSGFVPGVAVRWNGSPLATSYVSTSELIAAVPAAYVAMPGTATVTVSNPGTTTLSNFVYFPVAQPRKTIAFAYPSSKPILGLPPANSPSCQAIGDFNGDGKPDIAIGEPQLNGGSLVVLLGDGDGTFTLLPPIPAPRCGWGGIVSGDFEADGKLDLVMADTQTGAVSALLSNGDGTFTPASGPTASAGSSPLALAAADFNSDGKLDVAVMNSHDGTICILLGNGDGTFGPAPGPLISSVSPSGIAVGDFNRDGKLDLAFVPSGSAGGDSVMILLGNGDGTFVSAPGSPVSVGDPGRRPAAIVVADLNGDRKIDLAVASGGYETVAVLFGNGDGTFAAQGDCCGTMGILAGNDADLGIGDFHGNGKLDLALANEDDLMSRGPRFVTVFVGSGDGIFTPSNFSILQDATQTNLAVADFNGDGELDIAMTDPTYAEETILLQSPPPGNGPDISITPADSDSITVKAGEAASFPINVTSLNGFTGVVTYACSRLPANTTCSFSTYNDRNTPNTSDFYVDTVWSLFRLNVQTTAPTVASGVIRNTERPRLVGLASLLFGLTFALSVKSIRRSRKVYSLSIAPFVLLLPFFLLSPVSCGGSTRTPPPQHLVGGTSSGTYVLTVTATSGTLSRSTNVTLTVQ